MSKTTAVFSKREQSTAGLRPDALRAFVRVAELASFTKAAESLGLPKGRVSAAVQRLEKQTATQLLHRTTRRVQLTQDGRLFYERSKDVLADLDELQSMFEQQPQSLKGRLRVDMPSGIARDHVIPALPEFLSDHPLLEVELSCTERKVDLIREGFDCVVRVGTLEDPSLVARPLGRLTLVNCASPGYLEAFGTPRTVADLAHHRLIHYATTFGSKPFGFEYFDGGAYRTVAMHGAVTVNGAEAYSAACVAGLGIIQVPKVGMQKLLASGRLVEVLPEARAEPMPVTLLYAQRRNLSRRVQAFMGWLTATLAPLIA
jgi:DNA-binding transcriptional LysR family regulator